MEKKIAHNNLFISQGDYNFCFSKKEFLELLQYALSTGWVTVASAIQELNQVLSPHENSQIPRRLVDYRRPR